jgi:hypothetical protein
MGSPEVRTPQKRTSRSPRGYRHHRPLYGGAAVFGSPADAGTVRLAANYQKEI